MSQSYHKLYKNLHGSDGKMDDEFYKKLHSNEYKELAYQEFALVKQLKVSGFPALFLQASESKFYLLANGFTEYETLKTRIDNVLNEASIESKNS